MIQECVSVYAHILVSWPVDDPSLGLASCHLIKLFVVCVGCDGLILTYTKGLFHMKCIYFGLIP